MNLVVFVRHLRLRPFPFDTEDGRAAERYRRASWTMLAHAASSAASMLVLVLSVSWTVPYLGAERFGAWMTIASLAALLSFLDLGVGNGLTNRIAHAASDPDHSELSRAVTGGIGVLVVMSMALLLLLATGAWLLPWQVLIKTTSVVLDNEIRTTAYVFAGLFAASTCANGVLRVYHGLQRGFQVFATNTVCTLIGLLLLYVAARYRAGMPVLLLCTMGSAVLPGIWLWTQLWRKGLFRLLGCAEATRIEISKLLSVSLLFFVLQIGTAFGWGMDSLIISSTLGAATVTAFTLTQRLYLIATQPMLILNGPLWPAYADADSRNDRIFIRKTLASATRLTFVYTTGAAAVLIWLSNPLLGFWTNGQVAPPAGLVYALGVWTVTAATANSFAMFMNGAGILRPQAVAVLLIVIVGVPLKFFVAQTLGIDAMIYAFTAYFAITLGLLYGIVYRPQIKVHLGLS